MDQDTTFFMHDIVFSKFLIDSLTNYKEAKSSVISDDLHFNSKLK